MGNLFFDIMCPYFPLRYLLVYICCIRSGISRGLQPFSLWRKIIFFIKFMFCHFWVLIPLSPFLGGKGTNFGRTHPELPRYMQFNCVAVSMDDFVLLRSKYVYT